MTEGSPAPLYHHSTHIIFGFCAPGGGGALWGGGEGGTWGTFPRVVMTMTMAISSFLPTYRGLARTNFRENCHKKYSSCSSQFRKNLSKYV